MPGLFGNFGNRIGGMFSNFDPNMAVTMAGLGMLSGQNPQEGFRNAMYGIASGREMDLDRRDRKKKREEEERRRMMLGPALDTLGASPELRSYFEADPDAGAQYLMRQSAPDPMSAESWGVSPIFAEGPGGELGAFAASNRGNVRPMQFPEGFNPITGTYGKADTGLGTQTFNNRTGQPGPFIPKDVAGAAAEQELGASQGKNAAALPATLNATQRLIQGIDDLISDPAAGRLTGPVQSWLPNMSGGAHRAQSRLDLVMGGTFLQAYNDLRGAGQITEQEGQAAKAAYNRLMQTGMSDSDFKQALLDFRNELVNLMEIAARKAGSQTNAAPETAEDGWIDLGNGVRMRQVR